MLTFMCGTFGMNFDDNWFSTSPINTRLVNVLRIFMIRTIAASIKWPLFSSIRWSVCFCSVRRSNSNLAVMSNRIFGLEWNEIHKKWLQWFSLLHFFLCYWIGFRIRTRYKLYWFQFRMFHTNFLGFDRLVSEASSWSSIPITASCSSDRCQYIQQAVEAYMSTDRCNEVTQPFERYLPNKIIEHKLR